MDRHASSSGCEDGDKVVCSSAATPTNTLFLQVSATNTGWEVILWWRRKPTTRSALHTVVYAPDRLVTAVEPATCLALSHMKHPTFPSTALLVCRRLKAQRIKIKHEFRLIPKCVCASRVFSVFSVCCCFLGSFFGPQQRNFTRGCGPSKEFREIAR